MLLKTWILDYGKKRSEENLLVAKRFTRWENTFFCELQIQNTKRFKNNNLHVHVYKTKWRLKKIQPRELFQFSYKKQWRDSKFELYNFEAYNS